MVRFYRTVPHADYPVGVEGDLLWVSGRGRGCTPTVYLDGGLAYRGSTTNRGRPGEGKGTGIALDALINTALVGAIEVYQDGSVSPVRFHPVGDRPGGDCAIVVLWSRAALGPKDGKPAPN